MPQATARDRLEWVAPPAEGPPQVLLAEYHAAIAEPFAHFLEAEGFRVLHARSYEAALEVLDNASVSLVITSLQLNGRSGLDLVAAVRRRLGSVPVICTTGMPTIDTAVEALRFGALDYLIKPINRKDLVRATHRALASRIAKQSVRCCNGDCAGASSLRR